MRPPFGLKYIPGLWSRLADMIFKGLKWSIVNDSFDDMCVFSKTAEDHVRGVALVLVGQANQGRVYSVVQEVQIREVGDQSSGRP